MPYVNPPDREKINSDLWDIMAEPGAETWSSGELNYAITKILMKWVGTDLTYGRIATATGILDNVKTEFYRRVVVPYEEKKRQENGDVY